MTRQWPIRLAGVVLVITSGWFGVWMTASLNGGAIWLSVPFWLANMLILAVTVLTVINNWQRTVPPERLVAAGSEPVVAVIIPTCGEPIRIVEATVVSVLNQCWPRDRLRIVVSDDRWRSEMQALVGRLQVAYPDGEIAYHQPPKNRLAGRSGAAKAGNLNSALAMIDSRYPEIAYIETRDADDEVGDPNFLRQCIGQLAADPVVAYVQTIKECQTAPGDPFANNDTIFYRGTMLARNAANAVFPCGSGLVWRRSALRDIGEFPTWNLVEDLQSGVEALRRGWKGLYLPIVGAIGQHAPEDLPNVYKQRGTWALDTIRLFLWGDIHGLTLRQRLHFAELVLFYLLGLAVLVFIAIPILSFVLNVYPLTTTQFDYALHFWPYAAAIEVFLVALNGRSSYEMLWRARQLWLGLTPVYLWACWLAIRHGPNRKPQYHVTRKTTQVGWYWRETAAHAGVLLLLAISVLAGLVQSPVLTSFDLGSAYWAGFFFVSIAGFIQRGWHGLDPRAEGRRLIAAVRPLTAPIQTLHSRAISYGSVSRLAATLRYAPADTPPAVSVPPRRTTMMPTFSFATPADRIPPESRIFNLRDNRAAPFQRRPIFEMRNESSFGELASPPPVFPIEVRLGELRPDMLPKRKLRRAAG